MSGTIASRRLDNRSVNKTGADELAVRFQAPRPDSRPVAFWFLDGRVTPEEVEFQVAEMKRQGVRVVVPQKAGGSLAHLYLSESWFQMIGSILDAAARHEMQVWLYDDGTTMSGSVEKRLAYGGRWGARAIVCRVEPVLGRNSVPMPVTGPEETPWGWPFLLGVMIHPPGAAWREVSSWIAPDGLTLRIPKSEPAPQEIFFFLACPEVLKGFTSGDVDRTNPEAVEEFLNLTHREYARRFPDRFGPVISGVFTDEIALCEQPVFARHFFAEFQRRKGYDFHPYLPALYFDMGPATIRARCDFHAVIGALYTEAFFKKAADWCRAHGVAYTGHLCWEEYPDVMCTRQGDPFLPYGDWDYPGIDCICGIKKLNPLVPKLAASVAHWRGKERVMGEAFAGCGLAFRYQDMKWMTHWLMVCGVDLMVPHHFYYAADYRLLSVGHPCVFLQHPGWPWYHQYSDYVGRLSEMLRAGTHAPRVAVLYPRDTIWANTTFPLTGHTQNVPRTDPYGQSDAVPECPAAVQPVADDLNAVVDVLINAPVDFEVVATEALANAVVEGGCLRIGAESYSTVVLPHVTVESAATLRTLARFADQGGQIIAWGGRPECSSGDEQETVEVRAIAQRLFDTAGQGTLLNDRVAKLPAIIHDRDLLVNTPFVKSRERNIHYQHRRDGDQEIYFLVSHSLQPETVHLSFLAAGEPELWDPENGGRYRLVEARVVNGRTELDLKFEPYGAHFVVFNPARDDSLPPWQPVPTTPVLRLAGDWEIEFLPNGDHRFLKQFDGLFRFETRQAPLVPWSELGMAHFSGRVRYAYCFDLPKKNGPRLLLDLGRVEQTAEVSLNGQRAGSRIWPPYRLDVTDHVRDGANRLEVLVTNTLGNVLTHPQLKKGPMYQAALNIPPDQASRLPTPEQLVSGLLGPVTLSSAEPTVSTR